MDSRLLATIIIFPIWLTLVITFRRQRQWFLYYLIAAFGLTIQVVLLAEYLGIDQLLVNMASFHVELISKYLFKIQMELLSNGRFQLIAPVQGADILKLGIECSAILESSVVISLVIFYPLFNFKQKILRALFGLVVTYAINILRLLIIVLIANKFGSDYIFLAHAAVARIFFFICELLLYWYLLTKPTVKSVGASITHHTNVSEEATVGHSLKLRHAVYQVVVIVVILGTLFGSFKLTDEWKVAFSEPYRKQRPIIYKPETGMEKAKEILGEEIKLPPITLSSLEIAELPVNKTNIHKFRISENDIYINFRISGASQPLEIELYLNNVFQNRSLLEKTAENADENMIFQKNTYANKNDIMEIRIKNIGQASDKLEVHLEKINYE